MNEEFQNKIIEDLEKSGFGSEMRAIKKFLAAEWGCSGSQHYFDSDEEKNKEIDLIAYKSVRKKYSSSSSIFFWYYIVAEVKKSEKPWVVFIEDFVYPEIECIDAWNNLTFYSNLNFESHELSDSMTENSLTKMLQWRGYGIHESFKKPDAHSRWYSAFVSVCKAAENRLSIIHQYNAKTTSKEFYFVKPVVVLDGTLVAARLTDEGSVNLQEIKFAPFEFYNKTKSSKKSEYRVDVVTLNGLSEYIGISEARQRGMFTRLLSITDMDENAT